MHEEPFTRVNYQDFVPEIEEKKNKKNESCLNFAHRLDLHILKNMNSTEKPRKRGVKGFEKDQIFTLGELNPE